MYVIKRLQKYVSKVTWRSQKYKLGNYLPYVFVFFVSLLDLEKSMTFKNRFAQLFGAPAGVTVFIFITGHVPR